MNRRFSLSGLTLGLGERLNDTLEPFKGLERPGVDGVDLPLLFTFTFTDILGSHAPSIVMTAHSKGVVDCSKNLI